MRIIVQNHTEYFEKKKLLSGEIDHKNILEIGATGHSIENKNIVIKTEPAISIGKKVITESILIAIQIK